MVVHVLHLDHALVGMDGWVKFVKQVCISIFIAFLNKVNL